VEQNVKALCLCISNEKSLRAKMQAIVRELSGLQVDICDDSLIHDDFSCHKGHVLFRCLRSVQARLKVTHREVRIRKSALERAQKRKKESWINFQRFKKWRSEPVMSQSPSIMKENRWLNNKSGFERSDGEDCCSMTFD